MATKLSIRRPVSSRRSPPSAHLKQITAIAILLAAVLFVGGCEKPPKPKPPTPAAGLKTNIETLPSVTARAWRIGGDSLLASQQAAGNLKIAVKRLLDNPDQDTLVAAREAWHATHNQYQSFAVFLTLAQSNPGLFGALRNLNSPLDTWPIEPGYLDYFDIYAHSGIVNDIAVPLTAKALRQQHGFSDSADVSLGLHAIAYLLWGEKGERSVTDFIKKNKLGPTQASTGLRVIDLPNNRRRTLLALLCNLLSDDLQQIRRAWNQKGPGSLQQNYLALTPLSRLHLLRVAAEEFIAGDLLARNLISLLKPALDTAHNRFAGGNAGVFTAGLGGLETLLLNPEEPETAIVNWLLGDAEKEQLKHRFATANQLLNVEPLADFESATLKHLPEGSTHGEGETPQSPASPTPQTQPVDKGEQLRATLNAIAEMLRSKDGISSG